MSRYHVPARYWGSLACDGSELSRTSGMIFESQRDSALTVARDGKIGRSRGRTKAVLPAIESAEGGASPAPAEPFQSARRTLAGLAVEALRREEISAGRFRELAERARLTDADVASLIAGAEGQA